MIFRTKGEEELAEIEELNAFVLQGENRRRKSK